MLVTRTEVAKNGRFSPSTQEQPFVFCDWISLRQWHPEGGLPILNDGYVVRFGPESLREWIDPESGEVMRAVFDATKAEFTTSRSIEHEGSYETKLSIRCDGSVVELSGNVSRFGRPDNLFGEGVIETINKASDILESLGLPRFSDVERGINYAHGGGFMKPYAVITRVDLTANYETGSEEAARRVLQAMCGQGTKRGGKSAKGYGNGVTWNEGSRRHYQKLYFKADSLGQWASPEVHQYCRDKGILRFECSVKARELADRGLQRISDWARSEDGQSMENVIYGQFSEVLQRDQVALAEVGSIPGKLGMYAAAYLDGRDPYHTLIESDRTRRRVRKQLLDYGIDIAQPMQVQHLTARCRVVEMRPVAVPDWYQVAA